MLRDKLMPIYYTPEDLRLCLKGQKLVESLPIISSYAFTYDQLKALKDNLDKAKLLIKQYLDSGGQLNSTALDAIGPKYICLLDKDQFSMIDEEAINKNGVNMDIETFMSLRKDSVMALTVDEVKGLLGRNLRELKDYQEQPVISSWIHRQKQSDLDSLDLGLRGGLPDGYIVLPLPSYRKKREAFAFGRI
ncbi:hypothetical protein JD844_019522 [Phrynosoma platyrhinos]|uniref:Uncharacterized protein n=1 Tax=Phrynosoma platyrhinos TaxID=52577 RepID=A0ABQ7TQA4_PHRPL|nr:hypothetical protein JD844_019522 [Phrynosoma platyrhinos]